MQLRIEHEEAKQQLAQATSLVEILQKQLKEATGTKESPHLSLKVPDPEPFDGTRSKLRPFLATLRLKFITNDRYPTAQSRLTHVYSLLRGAT